MATAPRKTSAAAEPQAPSVPVLEIGGEAPAEEWETLFTIDGKEYKLLKNPSSSLMLTYLDIARKEGVTSGFSWAMEAMLSEDGYQALLDDPRVSQEDFAKLGEVVISTLLGADPDEARKAALSGQTPKAASSSARRRPAPRR